MGVRTDCIYTMFRRHQRTAVQPVEGTQPVKPRAVAIRLALVILTALPICAGPAEAAGRISRLRPHVRHARSTAPDSGKTANEVALEKTELAARDTVAEATENDESCVTTKESIGEFGCCPDVKPWQREQDSIYIVSTRCLGCACGKVVPQLPVQRYDGTGQWQPSSVDDLAQDCEDSVVSIHVHGNRIDNPEAVARGWAVYHEWVRRDPHATRLVFVIWSWPSSQIKGPLKDVRTKAARTETEGFFLAHLISAIPAETRVSLSGHSYGARIICGAAHLLAGGYLWGYRLDEHLVQEQRELRAVLTAAAMHNYWLSPGYHHGQALTQIGRMLVLYNSSDPALRLYRHIERGSRPAALGYRGAVFCSDPEGLSDRVDQINVAGYIGQEHSFLSYLCCPALSDLAAPYALFLPTTGP
jgi:hypothetical protein